MTQHQQQTTQASANTQHQVVQASEFESGYNYDYQNQSVTIEGEIPVNVGVKAANITVNGHVYGDAIASNDITVHGSVVGGNLEGSQAHVDGNFVMSTGEFGTLTVGGNVKKKSSVKAQVLQVNGPEGIHNSKFNVDSVNVAKGNVVNSSGSCSQLIIRQKAYDCNIIKP